MSDPEMEKIFDIGVICDDVANFDLASMTKADRSVLIIGDLLPPDIEKIVNHLDQNPQRVYFSPPVGKFPFVEQASRCREVFIQSKVIKESGDGGVLFENGIKRIQILDDEGVSCDGGDLKRNSDTVGAERCFKMLDNMGEAGERVQSGYQPKISLPLLIRPFNLNQTFLRLDRFRWLYPFLRPIFWLGNLILKLKFSKAQRGVEISEVQKFSEALEPKLKQFANSFKLVGHRTVSDLNNRFFKSPSQWYQVFSAKKSGEELGYVVVKETLFGRFRCYAVVDLVFFKDPESTIKALLGKVHDLALHERMDLITLLVNQKSPVFSVARSLFYLGSSKVRTVCLLPNKEEASHLNFPLDEESYLTWYDSDEL